mmetsp:Transcript_91878/g.264345  ORF Transcript_91878/g.264345 Transcript_91878/m.264345 type:complete len:80 (-) Transcript_91878:53-292(-)
MYTWPKEFHHSEFCFSSIFQCYIGGLITHHLCVSQQGRNICHLALIFCERQWLVLTTPTNCVCYRYSATALLVPKDKVM